MSHLWRIADLAVANERIQSTCHLIRAQDTHSLFLPMHEENDSTILSLCDMFHPITISAVTGDHTLADSNGILRHCCRYFDAPSTKTWITKWLMTMLLSERVLFCLSEGHTTWVGVEFDESDMTLNGMFENIKSLWLPLWPLSSPNHNKLQTNTSTQIDLWSLNFQNTTVQLIRLLQSHYRNNGCCRLLQ